VSEERSLWKLACLTVPLVCLLVVVQHFNVESNAFFRLFGVAIAGFVVQYFLPLRARLWFFVALSISALAWILGVERALWIAGLGALLIGVCHLPVAFWLRTALLVAVGGTLAAFRGGWVPVGIPPAVWPIFGSLFMFRLAVYMYDLRHDPALASPARTLAYFFLLPNVCFPLFPVVDFKTFCRYYFNADRHEIHMVGVQWIYRGITQLILYRLAYQTLVTTPESVETVADLGQHLLWPYLLYLRVSGQFHVIVGILRLFGFNLPETHHLYYLASSFTDFWRRINIYWKDFMMKLFYYPAFFALRKRGETLALVLSTVLVFVVTWALHSYQTFWIQGFFLLAWHDALFWAVLAGLVVVNALLEWKKGRQRRLAGKALTWPQTWRLAGQTLAMFVAMCLLWSMWSTESLSTWTSLWTAILVPPGPGDGKTLLLLAFVASTIVIATIANARSWSIAALHTFEARAAIPVAVSAMVVLGTTSTVYKRAGEAGQVLSALRFGGLNRADAVELERGSYENLMGVERFNGQLWDLYQNRPPDWQQTLIEAGVAREVGGLARYELLPSAVGRFKGAELRTNRWGMHDKEYELEPAMGCRRIAVLGASHTMGSGVATGDTFEAVLEARLNESPPGDVACVEVLNFAVYGYNPVVQIEVLTRRVAPFSPTAILYVAHPGDGRRLANLLVQLVREGHRAGYPELDQIIEATGVTSESPQRLVEQRLLARQDELLASVYRELARACLERSIHPGYVLLPMVPEEQEPGTPSQLAIAAAAGFDVIDLSDVYEGSDRESLWVAEWDAHPNARGHALVGSRLYRHLHEKSGLLNGPPPPKPGMAGPADNRFRP
jgi:hypothetical protein